MKITFIDMLNKMANNDYFRPITIKFYNDLFVWNSLYKDWLKEDGTGLLQYNFPNTLKNEMEIIEENSKIEKIKYNLDSNNIYIENEYGKKCYLTKHSKVMCDKINEIIDKINGDE